MTAREHFRWFLTNGFPFYVIGWLMGIVLCAVVVVLCAIVGWLT